MIGIPDELTIPYITSNDVSVEIPFLHLCIASVSVVVFGAILSFLSIIIDLTSSRGDIQTGFSYIDLPNLSMVTRIAGYSPLL